MDLSLWCALQDLKSLHEQMRSVYDSFANRLPAWHLLIQYLKTASELDLRPLAVQSLHTTPLTAVPDKRQLQVLEHAISSLLIWAQTCNVQNVPKGLPD